MRPDASISPLRVQGIQAQEHQSDGLGQFLSLHDLMAIGRRYWITLLGLPLATALLGLYSALAQVPEYEALVLVQLDPKPSRPLARSDDIYDPGYDSPSYYHTQIVLIESRKLAAQLVERLNLVEVPEFGGSGLKHPSLVETLLSKIPGMPPAPPPLELSSEEIHATAVNRTMRSIKARLAKRTTLIEITFKSRDPQLAAQAVNTLADIYIEELLQARLDIYAKATLWISAKLGDVGDTLNLAESRLQEFRESRDLVNVGGNRSLLEEELATTSRQLRAAEQLQVRLETQYQEIRRLMDDPAGLGQAQSLLLDSVVKSTAETYLNARQKLGTIESRYGKKHPNYAAAAARLREAEASYLDQMRIKAQGLQSELQIAKRNTAELRAAVLSVRSRLKGLDRETFDLDMLERDVRNNQRLFDAFLARFNETESSSSYSESNARIADPAVVPSQPFRPKVKNITLVWFCVGAVFAVFIVLLRQLLQTRIEHPEEVEGLTQVPLIGVVPNCKPSALKDSAIKFISKQPRSAFADSVASVKTALLMARQGDKHEGAAVYAITSAEPSEGKTTLCASLGASLSHNAKVLLIDADLRRPALARHFGVSSSKVPGLSNLMHGEKTLEDVVQQGGATDSLRFIGAGRPVPNPGLLLESELFAGLLEKLRQQYDYILIDTPPVLATGDALHISRYIDGYLLVARAEKTHKQALLGMLKRLEIVGAKCAGIVLNGAVLSRNAYTGYYYYGSMMKY